MNFGNGLPIFRQFPFFIVYESSEKFQAFDVQPDCLNSAFLIRVRVVVLNPETKKNWDNDHRHFFGSSWKL